MMLHSMFACLQFSLSLKSLVPMPESIDVCVEDETMNYMNRRDVKKALHARLVGVRRWEVCSKVLDYDLLNIEIPTISIVGSLVKAEIPVLVYCGDNSTIQNFSMGWQSD